MSDQEHKVDRWRRRAEELRAMAAQMSDKDARGVVLEIAEEWDRMAEQVEGDDGQSS